MSTMSGHSFATGSMRSCAGSVRLGTASGHEVGLDALYETKRDKKSVRVLTVIIYVFCVSLAAIMLSLYYVFFWEPKDAHYTQRKVAHTVEQPMSTTPLPTCFMPHTGRGNTTVNNLMDIENNSTIDNEKQTTDQIIDDISDQPADFELNKNITDITSNFNDTQIIFNAVPTTPNNYSTVHDNIT